jgi:hypothetical protein
MNDDGAETAPVFALRERQAWAARLVVCITQARTLHYDAGEWLAGGTACTDEPTMRALIVDIGVDMQRIQSRISELAHLARLRQDALRHGTPKVTQK